jgi:hypothetical protein
MTFSVATTGRPALDYPPLEKRVLSSPLWKRGARGDLKRRKKRKISPDPSLLKRGTN